MFVVVVVEKEWAEEKTWECSQNGLRPVPIKTGCLNSSGPWPNFTGFKEKLYLGLAIYLYA